MRLFATKQVTLQQDFYAALSYMLGAYEKLGKLKGKEKAEFLIHWSLLLKNVLFEHLEKEMR